MRFVFPVLLVEDDDVHVRIFERAFKETGVDSPLFVTPNGEEALAFLRDSDNPAPGVIVLDLNMPRMNGFEFLRILNLDESLKKIPVVVLTTSGDRRDIEECFDLGVAGYMIKPVSYEEFLDMTGAIVRYWTYSELPYEE